MHILLIEPDKLLARSYRQALEGVGHSVALSPTAQAAIHLADQQRPDLVILEIQLVSHSGIEFLYEFRSYTDWQTIPVIALSQIPPAEFMGSWQILQAELGVTAYYYKPHISLAKLVSIVTAINFKTETK